MPIYLGTKKLDGLYLGAGELSKVYLGTTLVYQKGGGPSPGPTGWTLFDHGWVSGFDWTGNYLPRPRYTTLVTYNFGSVESRGNMKLAITSEPGYSNVSHNGHLCTTTPIIVPPAATSLKLMAQRTSELTLNFNWGLLPLNAPNALDTSEGGQLTALASHLSTDEIMTVSMDLDDGLAGGSYYVVINMVQSGYSYFKTSRSLDIFKVWFE